MNPTPLAITNICIGVFLGAFVMWQIMIRKIDKLRSQIPTKTEKGK